MQVNISHVEGSNLPYINAVKGSNVSPRYALLDSNEIIRTLKDKGFFVQSVSTTNARKRAGTAHVVTMAHNDLKTAQGDLITVNFINSFDGSKAFRIGLGVFRFVCANGLWAGDAFYMSPKMKHIGMIEEKVEYLIAAVLGKVAELNKSIEVLTKTELTNDQILAFENKVLSLRFGQETTISSTVGQVRRPEDQGNTAWAVLNRTQENVINGGFKYGPKSARKISSPARLAELNGQLFNEMLALVA